MKKINITVIIVLVILSAACNVVDSLEKERLSEEYQFETDATVYSLQDTVNASFTNLSDQTFILHYQYCTIAGLQKWEIQNWKAVTIPIYCAAVVRDPVKVEPGESRRTGIALRLFDKQEVEEGFYRLDVLARHPDEEKPRKLTSNNFKITK